MLVPNGLYNTLIGTTKVYIGIYIMNTSKESISLPHEISRGWKLILSAYGNVKSLGNIELKKANILLFCTYRYVIERLPTF